MLHPQDYPASDRDMFLVFGAVGVGVLIGICLYACYLS